MATVTVTTNNYLSYCQ